MTKTAFLHIGPPKTGTTTIQEMLFANRAFLLANKVFLPNELNHISVFKYFSARHKPDDYHHPILDEFFQALDNNYSTYIITSEFFSAFQKGEFQHIKYFFDAHHIALKIVIYIRHPLAIVISAKQEMLKKGFSFNQLEEQSIGMRYSNVIKRLLDVFDCETVIFRKFGSPGKDFDLVKDFCENTQITIESIQKTHKNRSLSLEAAFILDVINQRQNISQQVKQDMLKQLTKIKGQPFVLSSNELNKLKTVINYELKWLKNTLGIEFDDYAPEGYTEVMRNKVITAQEAQKYFSALPIL